MWVPLHDLASRSPSAPTGTDRRTNTGLSHNIYHASIASRDKNLEYLFVGHQRVNLKVLPSNFFYVIWNSVSCDWPLPNAKWHLPRSSVSYSNTPEWHTVGPPECLTLGMTDLRNGGPLEWRTRTNYTVLKWRCRLTQVDPVAIVLLSVKGRDSKVMTPQFILLLSHAVLAGHT